MAKILTILVPGGDTCVNCPYKSTSYNEIAYGQGRTTNICHIFNKRLGGKKCNECLLQAEYNTILAPFCPLEFTEEKRGNIE